MKSIRSSFAMKLFIDFYSHNAGFTLIEILVTMTILSVFAAGMMFAINPKDQIDKAKNASRINNLKELKNALQLYYEDNTCYPQQESSFTQVLYSGGQWVENGTVYMQEVPREGDESYVYITDPDEECPQWNVVFSKLARAPKDVTCPLVQFPGGACTPTDYDQDEDQDGESDNAYACVLSGAVNCQFISNEASLAAAYGAGSPIIPTPTDNPGGGLPGGPTQSPGSPTNTPGAPTPTPGEQLPPEIPPGGSQWYDTSADLPDVTGGVIAPYPFTNFVYTPPLSGSLQYFEVSVENPTSPVVSVEVLVVNDSTNMTNQSTLESTAFRRTLTLGSGSALSGTWEGTWVVEYSLFTRYKIIVIVRDANAEEYRVELPYYGQYDTIN